MKIKAGTFNIQHGKDYRHFLETGKERIDLQLMADTIRAMDVDFCGLNEVRNQDGEGLCNQAKIIGNLLGWESVFTAAIPIRNGFYGNALVSRFPIRTVKAIPIETLPEERTAEPHYENRVLLIAELEAEGTVITVTSCHFGLREIEKNRAVETVLRETEKITSPLLFMGDLNLTPEKPQIRRLAEHLQDTAAAGSGEMLTFPSENPNRKIDYIFAKNCKILSAEVIPLVAADHLPVRAELDI